MARLIRLALTFSALFFTLALPVYAEPALKRGVSLHGPLTWGRANADRSGYQFPVFEGERYALPTSLLKQTKAAGFDFIRLTVDPGPFMALEGEQRDALFTQLADTVKHITSIGLDVVVDFHPISMIPAYAPLKLETDPALLERYADVISRTAEILNGIGAQQTALELMNEPQYGYNGSEIAQVQHIMERLFTAAREKAPDLTIIVSGGRGGSMEGLAALDPARFDAHTLYSFHYYLPFILTHMGVPGEGKALIRNYAFNLSYPAKPEEMDAYWQQVKLSIESDPKLDAKTRAQVLKDGYEQVQDYFTTHGNPSGIAADFQKVADWAKQHGIPQERIFLGEFGITQPTKHNRGTDAQSRANWLEAVRKEAEKNNFHWAMWALTGDSASGMTLTLPNKPGMVDPLVVKALIPH